MEIQLLAAQYEILIKLIYLGQMVVQMAREDNNKYKEYDAVASYIYSYAPRFGFQRLVDFDESEGIYGASDDLEIMMSGIFNDFAEATFFDRLAFMLADRDLLEEYGAEEYSQMDLIELEEKRNALIEKYLREFAENGVNNLVLERVS